MQEPYSEIIVENMKFVFSQLPEKGRRLFAGLESQKLQRGGQQSIANLFGCSPKTVRRGAKELKDVKLLPEKERIRHKDGGRKRTLEKHPELNEQFEQVLAEDTAGSPMNEAIRWTNLTSNPIAEALSREEQFKNIATLRKGFSNALSIEIRMAHYPSYSSKWNPIEHRVFPHLTRAMQGVILTSHSLVQTLLERTTTRTGLKVVVNIVEKIYQTGCKMADDYKNTMRIVLTIIWVNGTIGPSLWKCQIEVTYFFGIPKL